MPRKLTRCGSGSLLYAENIEIPSTAGGVRRITGVRWRSCAHDFYGRNCRYIAVLGFVLRAMKNAFAISYADLIRVSFVLLDVPHSVHSPADRGAGHSGDDSGLQTTEVALEAFSLVDDLGSLEQTVDRPQLSIVSAASCLQKGLNDVQGRSKRRGKTTSQTTSETMRVGIVAASGVHDLRYRFV